ADIEDVLLRIQRHELASQFRKRIHDSTAHPAKTGVEGSKEPRGAAADDRYVPDFPCSVLSLAHVRSRVDGSVSSKAWGTYSAGSLAASVNPGREDPSGAGQ